MRPFYSSMKYDSIYHYEESYFISVMDYKKMDPKVAFDKRFPSGLCTCPNVVRPPMFDNNLIENSKYIHNFWCGYCRLSKNTIDYKNLNTIVCACGLFFCSEGCYISHIKTYHSQLAVSSKLYFPPLAFGGSYCYLCSMVVCEGKLDSKKKGKRSEKKGKRSEWRFSDNAVATAIDRQLMYIHQGTIYEKYKFYSSTVTICDKCKNFHYRLCNGDFDTKYKVGPLSKACIAPLDMEIPPNANLPVCYDGGKRSIFNHCGQSTEYILDILTGVNFNEFFPWFNFYDCINLFWIHEFEHNWSRNITINSQAGSRFYSELFSCVSTYLIRPSLIPTLKPLVVKLSVFPLDITDIVLGYYILDGLQEMYKYFCRYYAELEKHSNGFLSAMSTLGF
jgi:hypothetical protein